MGDNLYRTYMTSVAWKIKKDQYWHSRSRKSCYKCGKTRKRNAYGQKYGLQLHHVDYTRLGNEELSDLVPVCAPCHKQITAAWNKEKTKPYDQRLTLRELTDKVCKQGKYKPKRGGRR